MYLLLMYATYKKELSQPIKQIYIKLLYKEN